MHAFLITFAIIDFAIIAYLAWCFLHSGGPGSEPGDRDMALMICLSVGFGLAVVNILAAAIFELLRHTLN